jgi:hypothetical protein
MMKTTKRAILVLMVEKK